MGRKNKSWLNIETCNGVARADEKTRTCVLCVAANLTVYRSNNKCEYAHANCKCRYEPFSMDGAKVIFDRRKMIYFLTDNSKKGIAHKMGLRAEDADFLYNTLFAVAKKPIRARKLPFECVEYSWSTLSNRLHCKRNARSRKRIIQLLYGVRHLA